MTDGPLQDAESDFGRRVRDRLRDEQVIWLTTAGVSGWYRRRTPSQHSSDRWLNGVWPLGTGKPGKRYFSNASST